MPYYTVYHKCTIEYFNRLPQLAQGIESGYGIRIYSSPEEAYTTSIKSLPTKDRIVYELDVDEDETYLDSNNIRRLKNDTKKRQLIKYHGFKILKYHFMCLITGEIIFKILKNNY